MFRPRLIPVLLIRNNGLVKSIRFRQHRYIGDPINAVKIFSNFKADELMLLDIDATAQYRTINPDLVKEVGEEANMPFGVGGGIQSIAQIKTLLNKGAEKVIIGAEAIRRPQFVKEAAEAFGASTIAICIDIKDNFFGKKCVYSNNSKKNAKKGPEEFALLMQEMGAGELIIQSIDRDGTMIGYDIETIKKITENTTIPVVALGGCGAITHMHDVYTKSNASAVAASSLFIYHGVKKGVLISYPKYEEITNLFNES